MADNDQTAERRYLETAGPVLVGPGHGPTHLEELAGIVAELARRLEVLEDRGGPRLKFGPAKGNSVPAEWAEELLVRLHAADPPGFGVILMDLYRDRILGEDSLVRVAKGRASKGE